MASVVSVPEVLEIGPLLGRAIGRVTDEEVRDLPRCGSSRGSLAMGRSGWLPCGFVPSKLSDKAGDGGSRSCAARVPQLLDYSF